MIQFMPNYNGLIFNVAKTVLRNILSNAISRDADRSRDVS